MGAALITHSFDDEGGASLADACGFDAGLRVAVVRSPGPPCSSRRRGPRSSGARLRRSQRRGNDSELRGALFPRGGGLCEAKPAPPFADNTFSVLLVNIRGFKSHRAELEARICLMEEQPTLICLNETWLDKSTEEIAMSGYKCVRRLDRRDGRDGGGVAVSALL